MSIYKTKSNALRLQRELACMKQLRRDHLPFNSLRVERLLKQAGQPTVPPSQQSNSPKILISKLRDQIASCNLASEIDEGKICETLEQEILLVAKKQLSESDTIVNTSVKDFRPEPPTPAGKAVTGNRYPKLISLDLRSAAHDQRPTRLREGLADLSYYRPPHQSNLVQLAAARKPPIKAPEQADETRDHLDESSLYRQAVLSLID